MNESINEQINQSINQSMMSLYIVRLLKGSAVLVLDDIYRTVRYFKEKLINSVRHIELYDNRIRVLRTVKIAMVTV